MNQSPTSLLVRIIPALLLVGFLFLGSSGAASASDDVFEGRVKMKMTEGTTEQTIDYYVKGERMRVETGEARARGGVMIIDMSAKEILMLMPEQRMYMTMPVPDIGTDAEDVDEDKKPEATGETRTILGHTAEKYVVRDGATEYEIWATDELGNFGGLHIPDPEDPRAGTAPGRAMAGESFFPLLIVEHRNGREASRVEVVEVEREELSESLFEAPSGYRGMSSPFQLPR